MKNLYNKPPKGTSSRPQTSKMAKEQKNNNDGAFLTGVNVDSPIKNRPSSAQNSDENFDKQKRFKEEWKQIQIKKYEKYLEQISFTNNEYFDNNLLPGAKFWKFLARKPFGNILDKENKTSRLKCWIPDSLVFNDGDAMWFYTSEEGYVYRTDSFVQQNIQDSFYNQELKDEVRAIIKIPSYNGSKFNGNNHTVLSTNDLIGQIQNIQSGRSETQLLQRFIKCSGPNACFIRTVWKRQQIGVSYSISNKITFDDEDPKIPDIQKYCTNYKKNLSCNIIPSSTGKSYSETVSVLNEISQYLKIQVNVHFEELVGDFIKDESGRFWLVNIKGFKLLKWENFILRNLLEYDEIGQKDILQPLKNQKYQKLKKCKYCEIIYPVSEMNEKVTLKNIIQADQHILHRGKEYEWLQRYQNKKQPEISNLYQYHHICGSWFFSEINKLADLEKQFAIKCGLQVLDDYDYNTISLTNNFMKQCEENPNANLFTNKFNKVVPDPNWSLQIQPGQEMIVINNQPRGQIKQLDYLSRLRFFVLISSLNDLPLESLTSNFSIQYTIFNQTYTLKIKSSNIITKGNQNYIHINDLKVMYFFSEERSKVQQWIKHQKHIKFSLLKNGNKIGKVKFSLLDFLSEKVIKVDLHKYFILHEIKSQLNWGINISLGMNQGPTINITRVPLHEQYGIYLPNPSYYSSDPLPLEWIHKFEEQPDQIIQKQQNKFKINTTRSNSALSSRPNLNKNNQIKKDQLIQDLLKTQQ